MGKSESCGTSNQDLSAGLFVFVMTVFFQFFEGVKVGIIEGFFIRIEGV
jgi:hypothetical protein